MEVGTFGYMLAIVVGFLSILIFLHTRRTRSYTYPERYLLGNTFLLLSKLPVMLDFLKEAFDQIEKVSDTKTLHINPFLLPDLVITNSVENITYILKGNFESYGKGPIFKSRFQALLGDGIFNTGMGFMTHVGCMN